MQEKGISVTVTNSVFVNQEQVEKIFHYRLEQLTEGWYIATSQGIRERKKKQSYKPNPVLCREGEPSYHNGDTHREEERDLDDPEMQLIRRACELQDSFKVRRK